MAVSWVMECDEEQKDTVGLSKRKAIRPNLTPLIFTTGPGFQILW